MKLPSLLKVLGSIKFKSKQPEDCITIYHDHIVHKPDEWYSVRIDYQPLSSGSKAKDVYPFMVNPNILKSALMWASKLKKEPVLTLQSPSVLVLSTDTKTYRLIDIYIEVDMTAGFIPCHPDYLREINPLFIDSISRAFELSKISDEALVEPFGITLDVNSTTLISKACVAESWHGMGVPIPMRVDMDCAELLSKNKKLACLAHIEYNSQYVTLYIKLGGFIEVRLKGGTSFKPTTLNNFFEGMKGLQDISETTLATLKDLTSISKAETIYFSEAGIWDTSPDVPVRFGSTKNDMQLTLTVTSKAVKHSLPFYDKIAHGVAGVSSAPALWFCDNTTRGVIVGIINDIEKEV